MKTLFENAAAIVENRPLGCGCLFLMLASAFLLFAPTLVKLIAAGTVFICFFCLLLFRRAKPAFGAAFLRAAVCCLITLAACVSTFLAYDLFDKALEKTADAHGKAALTLCLKEEIYASDFSALYRAQVEKIEDSRVFGVETLVAFDNERPALFARMEGVCALAPLSSASDFDAEGFYRGKGIFSVVQNGDELLLTDEAAFSFEKPFHIVRSAVKERVASFTEGNTAGLLTALLTGDRSGLSSELKRDFRTLGISHLLAVSGMHLSILFALFEFILLHLRAGLRLRSVLLLLFVAGFMALCGFSPSVTRAGVMLIIFLAARLFSQKADPFTSLFLSGALIVLFSPFSVVNVSFLLSFFATFGILIANARLFGGRRGGAPGFFKRLLYMIGVSLAAQIAVLPIAALSFDSLSLLSALFTPVFSLLFTLLLFLAPFCLLLSFIPGADSAASAIVTLPGNLTAKLSSCARHFKAFEVRPEEHLLPVCLILIGAFVLLLILGRRRRLWASLAAGVYLLLFFVSFLFPFFAPARMILDLDGKNDMIVLYGHAQSALIDCSDGSLKYERATLRLLRAETPGRHPDALVLTHLHEKHYTLLKRLLAESYLEELRLPAPANETEEHICRALTDLALAHHVRVTTVGQDDDKPLAGGISLLGFEKANISRSTHPVYAFSLSCQNKTIGLLSSSAWEKISRPGGETLFLLKHGPVIKKPLSKPYDGARLFCADEGVRKALSSLDPSFEEAVLPDGAYAFFFE